MTNASFNNELESCSCLKLTEHIKKIILQPNLRENTFKGDILWHFDFSTKSGAPDKVV